VATELERGTLELVLSRPVGRTPFLSAKMAASLGTVTIVQIGGVVGTLIARWTIPEVSAVTVGDILLAFLGSWVLFGAVAMVGVLISAGSSLRGRATGAAVGVVVAGFFANFMASLIDEIDWLRYASPFHYFRPGDLMRGEGLLDLLVLVGVGALAAAAGIRRFATRDLTR
jgi:ABC-2 type transport system permease protein